MKVLAVLLTSAALLFGASFSYAQTAEELQRQIDNQNSQIAELNKEIAQYESQLNATAQKKKTLQNTLAGLDLQRKKTEASIKVTEKRIQTTKLEIGQLAQGIENKEEAIERDRAALAESIRTLRRIESEPLSVRILSSDRVSDFWRDADALARVQDAVQAMIARLSRERQSLADSKAKAEEKHDQLAQQQRTLTAQKGSLDAQRAAQNDLLKQTRSQESAYQDLIAKKRSQQAQFQAALADLKGKLQRAVSPDEITPAGKGILRWPVDNVRITQQFGDTAFARSGAYAGKGHNGIDLAAPIGTPLRAALSGTVIGVGNTDSVRGCYSFGRWIMIKHGNGLNTLYAHLSQTSVSQGESVATGQLIGYSGETGYATGPHLHFGVYVSSATQIMRLGDATRSSTPCSGAVMPVAPLSGYLNPLNYL